MIKKMLNFTMLLIMFLTFSTNVKADTFVPTGRLQYYEGYSENFNTGSMSFHESGYSYGSNIVPPLTPGYGEHPYAISLLLDGSYKSGSTYIFEATLHANIADGSAFKFYYPDIRYMAWFARLNYLNERVSCNFDMVIENSRFDITCSYQPSADSSRAIISFVNYDYVNNGYLTYDDLGTYFKWDNINIQLYSDSSGAIIEQNQTIINQNDTIINQNNQTNQELSDLNDSITSEDSPDTSGLSDVAGWLPPGPVDSLINLPLSLFNSISRDLSSSCSPVTLPLPYVNKELTLPCMSTFYDGIGIGSFMNWIGVIASGFILFSYLMKLYKWVDDTLTFRENNHLDNWGGV